MDNSNRSGIISLCITLAATALVLQDAYSSRSLLHSGQETLPSLLGSISPAATAFLAAGYVVSILAICYNRLIGGKGYGGRNDKRTDE